MEHLVHELSTRPFHETASNRAYHPHDYASVLKQYLGDLPEALMMTNHMEAYRQVAGDCTARPLTHIHVPIKYGVPPQSSPWIARRRCACSCWSCCFLPPTMWHSPTCWGCCQRWPSVRRIGWMLTTLPSSLPPPSSAARL